MVLITFTPEGQQRMCNLADVFKGRTAILMGGAPTIAKQPLHLLEQRGVLSAAMNNAARHFKPTLWFSADHPGSFEPQILLDPNIMKIAPAGHSSTVINDVPYYGMPNIYFYISKPDVPVGQMFAPYVKTPWYRNTLLVSIVMLHHLGVRRIILGGSDFEFSGKVYAHEDGLLPHERALNERLYKSQVYDLKRLRPIMQEAEIEMLDCSYASKLDGTYPVISMEEAVELALEDFPAEMVDPKTLPHGTRFANPEMKQELGIPDVPPEQVGDGMVDVL
jgi:hypothetical protein